jgi:hypothetical protein
MFPYSRDSFAFPFLSLFLISYQYFYKDLNINYFNRCAIQTDIIEICLPRFSCTAEGVRDVAPTFAEFAFVVETHRDVDGVFSLH